MLTRIIVGVLLFIQFGPAHSFPGELHGNWREQTDKGTGTVSVFIRQFDGVTALGVMQIDGSQDCPLPILFRGRMLEPKKMQVESTEDVVCGHRGRLSGDVTEGASAYTGSYQYVFLGFTWRQGTFDLKPVANSP